MKKSKKQNLFLPFAGLVAFTIGAIFLTFAPDQNILFSPGDNSPILFYFIPIFLLVSTLVILLITIFKSKK